MMTKEEYLKLVSETLSEVEGTVKKKNHDYTGGTEDPFANFRMSEIEGVDPKRGLMVRTGDKMQRIRTYLNRGELVVEGEGFEDAIHDVIGYMLLLKGMLVEERGNTKEGHWEPSINICTNDLLSLP